MERTCSRCRWGPDCSPPRDPKDGIVLCTTHGMAGELLALLEEALEAGFGSDVDGWHNCCRSWGHKPTCITTRARAAIAKASAQEVKP